MKSTRFLPLLCAAAALSAAASHADEPSGPPPQPPPAAPDNNPPASDQQPPPPAPEGRHHRGRGAFVLSDLTARLSLTAEQQKQVGEVIESTEQRMRDLRQDDSLGEDDKRAKGREIYERARSQIRAVLTPDQRKIFDTLPRRGGGRGGPPGAHPPTPAPTT